MTGNWVAFRYTTGGSPQEEIGVDRGVVYAEVIRGTRPPASLSASFEEFKEASKKETVGWDEYPIKGVVEDLLARHLSIPITHAVFVNLQPAMVLVSDGNEKSAVHEINEMQKKQEDISGLNLQWFISRGFKFTSQMEPAQIAQALKAGLRQTDIPAKFPLVANDLPLRRSVVATDPQTFDDVVHLTPMFTSWWPFTPGPSWIEAIDAKVAIRRQKRSGLVVAGPAEMPPEDSRLPV